MIYRFIIPLAVLMGLTSTAQAVQSCSIKVKDANNNVIHSVLYGRGDSIGGKAITKTKDCDVCRSGGRNEGPTLCAQQGGDEYTIQCVRNSGNPKKWDAPC
jgi:hypothetical protein